MLEGRVAIVTGGGRGIGRAHALRLAAYGARVVLNDAGVAPDGGAGDETPAAETVAAIQAAGGAAVGQAGDVSSLAVGEALVELAIATWGRLDIVVNNAGIGRPRMLFNMSEAEWDDVVRVHLKGTFAVSRAACRHWRAVAKRDGSAYGRLINTSTGLLVAGGAGQANYVAAKGGVAAFSEAAASEMAAYGVTVNAIMPAARTRLSAAGWRMQRQSDAYDDTDPTPIAELVCYLASPAAAAISGQTFRIRGGSITAVDGWRFGAEIRRDDRGFTAAELVDAMPRLAGRGPKPAARPTAGPGGAQPDFNAEAQRRGERGAENYGQTPRAQRLSVSALNLPTRDRYGRGMLDAAGHPLHTRSLSVTLRQGGGGAVDFAAYILDLRKRGFAPVGGDLQGTGIIHHMRLDGAIERSARRIASIAAQMPAVAFEASPTSGGESCRDLSGRVAQLAGTALDGGYAKQVGAEIGGPRGCSHILTLTQLLAPSARWGLDEDARLHGGVPARPAGERIFRRDVTADGYETAPGELVLTLQLNDLHFAPAAPQPQPMERFAAQREITARAAISMQDMMLRGLTIHERARTLATLASADWQERSAEAAPLLDTSLRAGVTARIMQLLPDAPLRDTLLQIAPSIIQCFAALDIWQLFPDGGIAGATGGLPDSCYMWRTGGGLDATRTKTKGVTGDQ